MTGTALLTRYTSPWPPQMPNIERRRPARQELQAAVVRAAAAAAASSDTGASALQVARAESTCRRWRRHGDARDERRTSHTI